MGSAFGAKLVKFCGCCQTLKGLMGVIVSGKDSDHSDQLQTEVPREFSSHSIHLVRTAQINTLTLSQMADQKASILIGATFVVFSLAVTRLIGAEITWSTISLAATAFLSSMSAVIAIVPTLGRPPKDSTAFNPLFFGHFASLDQQDWQETMLDQFATDETLFRAMLKDVHQNGMVLYRRKYRFLTYAYRIFLGGLLVTWLIYVAEFWSG